MATNDQMGSKAPLKEQKRNKKKVSNKNKKIKSPASVFNERARKVSLPQI